MKFCPVVPEICRRQVYVSRRERKKERRRRIIIIKIVVGNITLLLTPSPYDHGNLESVLTLSVNLS
jgi:hypothetical protein